MKFTHNPRLADYFQYVWHWESGIHFQFLAPLNSMAANIAGATLHSWGEVVWTDKRGNSISSKRGNEDNISTMAVKCNCLRFVLIDEIEAAGVNLLGELESTISRNASKRYKYNSVDALPRVWGGVNIILFGDLWQLPPTGHQEFH